MPKKAALEEAFERVAKGNFAPYLNEEEIIRLYTEAIIAHGNDALSKEEIAEYVRKRFADFEEVDKQFQSPIKLRFQK